MDKKKEQYENVCGGRVKVPDAIKKLMKDKKLK